MMFLLSVFDRGQRNRQDHRRLLPPYLRYWIHQEQPQPNPQDHLRPDLQDPSDPRQDGRNRPKGSLRLKPD